jgi:hypothetical protein
MLYKASNYMSYHIRRSTVETSLLIEKYGIDKILNHGNNKYWILRFRLRNISNVNRLKNGN